MEQLHSESEWLVKGQKNNNAEDNDRRILKNRWYTYGFLMV